MIDLDNGQDEAFGRQRAAQHGADLSISVELSRCYPLCLLAKV